MENKKPNMKRTNLFLTQKQHGAITKMAEEKEITISELVRRMIDNGIEQEKNKNVKK